MVEYGNSLDPDKEFDVLHSILDFPTENLDGDEDAADWDIGNGQCLGPIPSDLLMELPFTSNTEFDSAPIAGAPEQRKSDRVQESGSFHTHSHVSVLKSSGSCSREKNSSIISDNDIPLPPRKRSKPARYSGISLEPSTSKQASNSSRRKESSKRLPIAIHLLGNSPENDDISLNISDPAHQISSEPRPLPVRKCAHCQSSKTRLWRDGPLGPRTLCNACGIRYRSGLLFPEYRPKSSPTFVASQHSNSHKKVLEMRNEAKLVYAEIEVAPLSSKKEANIEESSIAPQMEAEIVELPPPQMIAEAPEVQESGSFHNHIVVSVLESSSFCSKEKNLSIISDNAIPLPPRNRSKPTRYSGMYLGLSSSKQTSNARRSRESRKKLPVAMDLMGNSPENIDNSLNISDPAHQISSKPRPPLAKKCAHCQSSKTPEWRDGPLGPKTLCNACGIRYRSGRLFQEYMPNSSPTFVASHHSNSHKEVVEMRNEAKRLIEIKEVSLYSEKQAKIEAPSISPRMEAKTVELPSPQMINEAPSQKQVPLHTDISNSLVPPLINGAPQQKHIERMQLAKHVETSTHVSLLETSRSYLKYRLKYFNHAGSDCVSPLNGSNPCLTAGKKCAHCESTKTPRWREGPLGPDTLCNACGLQYRAGNLDLEYLPTSSPTSMPSQPSNSQRKLERMRTKAMQSSADSSKVPPTLPDVVP